VKAPYAGEGRFGNELFSSNFFIFRVRVWVLKFDVLRPLPKPLLDWSRKFESGIMGG
jgi:hypothetical protein